MSTSATEPATEPSAQPGYLLASVLTPSTRQRIAFPFATGDADVDRLQQALGAALTQHELGTLPCTVEIKGVVPDANSLTDADVTACMWTGLGLRVMPRLMEAG